MSAALTRQRPLVQIPASPTNAGNPQGVGAPHGLWLTEVGEHHVSRRPAYGRSVRQVDASGRGPLRADARPPGQSAVTSDNPGSRSGQATTADGSAGSAQTLWSPRRPGPAGISGYKLKRHGPDPGAVPARCWKPQGNACAMCRMPFEADQRICIDHDHACCAPSTPSRCCGKCVRGLLCLTCNVALRVHRGVPGDGEGLPRTALSPPASNEPG